MMNVFALDTKLLTLMITIACYSIDCQNESLKKKQSLANDYIYLLLKEYFLQQIGNLYYLYFVSRVYKIWKPKLFKRVFYSEILDKHFEITVTMRTLDLIDESYGFDNYILKVSGISMQQNL